MGRGRGGGGRSVGRDALNSPRGPASPINAGHQRERRLLLQRQPCGHGSVGIYTSNQHNPSCSLAVGVGSVSAPRACLVVVDVVVGL